MKLKKLLVAGMATFALLAATTASAHGGRVGVYVGVPIVAGPLWYPAPYYPAPYYYQPAPVIVTQPSPPPVYVEQAPVAETQSYWYYCKSAKAYYPYVKECSEGWERVQPRPEK